MTDLAEFARNFDLFDPEFLADPYPTLAALREQCPVARSERHGGAWLPTTYDDITTVARAPERFSSREISVLPKDRAAAALLGPIPPIETDPPEHAAARRLVLPWFAPHKIEQYEQFTRSLARRLLDGFAADGQVDAADRYARQIPVRVIGLALGVPEERSDDFTQWTIDATAPLRGNCDAKWHSLR